MKIQTILNESIQQLSNPNYDSLKLSLNHVHGNDIFSLVIDGTEFGKLKRVFICDKKLKPFDVQYHTHRYPLRITVLFGHIKHHTATIGGNDAVLPMFDYKSPLNGGNGLIFDKDVNVILKDHVLPIGSVVNLAASDLHTMSCSKGSMWIVEEMGFETDSSKVIGLPFIVDGLYKEASQYQINDMCQRVKKQCSKLLDLLKHH